jgi:pimeloyl-ACP methyl ester carboxylesterase
MTSSDINLSAGQHTYTAKTNGKLMTFTYFVHRSGESTQPMKPLLIMQPPGWGIGATYMRISLTALEEHFTLVYLVTRGTKGSDRPAEETMMGAWNMAEDLESLRIHLGLEQLPAVLGHSNGGAIALAYAEKYPLRLERLILVDHQLIGNKKYNADPDLLEELKDDSRYKEAYELMHKRRDLSSDEAMLQRIKNIGPLYFFDPNRYVHRFYEALGDESISVWCYEHQAKCDARLRDPPILIDRMSEVKAKTLVIFGKDDMFCPIRHARRTKEGIPHAKVALYDDCGHFPWIEKPEQTFRDILEFMSL